MTSVARRAQPPRRMVEHARLVARAGWGLSAVLTVVNLVLIAVNWDTPSPTGLARSVEIVTAGAYVTLAGVGSLMVARDPDNPVGWVFLVSGLLLAASALASEYGTYGVLTNPASLPAVQLVTWAGAWGWWAGAGFGLTFGLMLYPDGVLPSARWRVVAAGASINLAVLVLLHALTPGPLIGEYSLVVNPFGVGSRTILQPLRDAAWLLLTANTLIAVSAVLARARRASADQRRQLRWLAIPGLAALAATPLWGLSGAADQSPSTTSQVLILAAVFGTPIVVALAIGRASRLARSIERLVLAREEERRRIRRDLHDGLGPTLAGIALQLDVARALVRRDPETAENVLNGIVRQVKAAITDIRRLVDDLRPPVLDQLGLLPAIVEGAAQLNISPDGAGLAVTVEAAGDLGRLPPATEVTAFRIVMEAVTNSSRHAKASACAVRLSIDRALEIRVEDDGCGIAPDHVPGVGLASMCERARQLGGTCTVEARPGGGTVVRASLPIRRQ
ncbi:MAG: sensor histidine kinase [Acidimicrobiales bacterium]